MASQVRAGLKGLSGGAVAAAGKTWGHSAKARDNPARFAPNRPGIFALASSSRENLIFLRERKSSFVLQSEINRPIN